MTAQLTKQESFSQDISIDMLQKYDVSGPRYTSYPTADRFIEAFTEADYIQALEQRRDRKADLAPTYRDWETDRKSVV